MRETLDREAADRYFGKCAQRGSCVGKHSRLALISLDTCLVFEKLVVHRALRVHHFGRVALVRGKGSARGVSALFWLLIFPCLPSASCMTASSITSVFEESCLGF